MGGTGLDRFAILDHRFDTEGLNGAGKPFAFRLFSVINRQREMVARKCGVHFQHLDCFFDRFLLLFRAQYDLPARETPSCAETGEDAIPNGRRLPIG